SEAKRNIILTPFREDGDISHRLYTQLVNEFSGFPDFPKKFGFVIDCGDDCVLSDVSGDIRIERGHDDTLIVRAAGADTGVEVDETNAVAVVKELTDWFVSNRPNDVRRMSKLLEHIGLPEKFQGVSPKLSSASEKSLKMLWAPFGQIQADSLSALVQQSPNCAIRITPWRAIFLDADIQPEISGLESDAEAAILDVSACAGSPYCPQATVETRALAASLAGRWPVSLHVSGCSKGCAKPSASEVTLVGQNGQFNLVRNGAACDDALYTHLSENALFDLDLI
ncbi:MAG: cobalamin biosynthesis protein CobG, partial [Paracoccaceae bacterium]|nr:cobalamin biosynthesis protein CobG [Paracoccaceae bacterium]